MPKLIKHPGARPPAKLTRKISKDLESILKIGGTIAEATTYARISERVYYKWQSRSEEFKQKMQLAKHYADISAKNVVVTAITKDKDLATAKWWLEKREFRNTDNRVNIQGEKVLVIPSELMGKYEITQKSSNSR